MTFDLSRELDELTVETAAPFPYTFDPVEERIRLATNKKTYEDAIDQIDERLKVLDERIIAEWMENETQNVKRLGQTLYLARRTWATLNKELDKEEILAAIRAAGAGHTITVNSTSLTAWVKEQHDRGGVPPILDGKIEMVEKVGLRMKKA
jgi:predicted RNase H-like nuclease (RuvC/YqgF family)